jgi:hypothetical protein
VGSQKRAPQFAVFSKAASAAPPASSSASGGGGGFVIIGAAAGGGALLLVVAAVLVLRSRRRRDSKGSATAESRQTVELALASSSGPTLAVAAGQTGAESIVPDPAASEPGPAGGAEVEGGAAEVEGNPLYGSTNIAATITEA